MRIDDSVLYEQFVEARLKAVELTDTYHQTPSEDPRRAILWEDVVKQTEVARDLLESWLKSPPDQPRVNALLTGASSSVNVS